jgi:hypothetical protein
LALNSKVISYRLDPGSGGIARQPGDLGILGGVAEGVWKEARIRGFAPPTLAKFAFIGEATVNLF